MSDNSSLVRRILAARVYPPACTTPTQPMTLLSQALGHNVLVKREDLQPVFSFKVRGAANKLAELGSKRLQRGVIAVSAGNHAQGVAMAATMRNTSALIVMPRTTPSIKVQAVRARGADVRLHGDTLTEAMRETERLKAKTGRVFVHPYDDPAVIAGQGTVAVELMQQVDTKIDAVFIPVGGGGLLAGMAVYIKYLHPRVKVIGVECDESACLAAALKAGKRVTLKSVGIFADGIAVRRIGRLPFELVQGLLDDVITVSTDEICGAIRDLFVDTRSIAEPAGAVALAGLKRYAALQQGRRHTLVAIESGANVDFNVLRYISERAEIGEGREGIFSLTSSEQPGELRALCRDLGDHDITSLSYRMHDPDHAHYLLGIAFTAGSAGRAELLAHLQGKGHCVTDLTDNELAKTHIAHMIGGQPTIVENEFLAEFTFPERPGALREFLEVLGKKWQLTLFHYRKQGGGNARVLAGIEMGSNRTALLARLRKLGFPYTEHSKNTAYQDFLTPQ